MARQVAAEAVGSFFLFAAVVGSGVMAERLAGGNDGVALLANTLATGAILFVLITMLAPVSGAQMNPAVSIVAALRGDIAWREAVLFVGAQLIAGIAGVWAVHLMFDMPLLEFSTKARTGTGQWLGEFVATFGLILTIIGTARHRPARIAPAVALYIVSAYWFTSSTSFANPAITVARALTDSFAGIAPADVPAFIVAQMAGALAGSAFGSYLFPKRPFDPLFEADRMNIENSRTYYGEVLGGSDDLRTDACCTIAPPPPEIGAALANVHDEVRAHYYGCGLVVPQAIVGAHVLDLGSGSGQDAYLLAQLVGEHGSVTGVDATPAQLAIADRHIDWHRERFGYARSNVRFVEGDIERLDALGLPQAGFDAIVSNCVINLVADKTAVLRAAHRLLKLGGELYFSDVYADRRVPEALLADRVLHGECLAGALYWGDFLPMAKTAGFADPRLVTDRPLAIGDAGIAARLDGIAFHSATYRLFKLDGLEAQCEDYGQAVRYLGTVPGSERVFALDGHHAIEAGRIFPVCGNTWKMLADTRFAAHFEFLGDFSRHYGVFPGCGTTSPFGAGGGIAASTSGCC